METKFCGGCDKPKSLTAFSRNKRMKDGRQTQCKECLIQQQRDWYGSATTEQKKWKWWTNTLWTKYRLRPEQYSAMLQEQQGKCLICEKEMKRPCVDHAHNTKKVRGLLCNQCNAGLGQFYDSIPSLQKAISYLTQHQS